MIGYLEKDLSWFGYYKLCFYDSEFMFDLQTELCRIFDKNSNVRIKFDFMFLYRSSRIRF